MSERERESERQKERGIPMKFTLYIYVKLATLPILVSDAGRDPKGGREGGKEGRKEGSQ